MTKYSTMKQSLLIFLLLLFVCACDVEATENPVLTAAQYINYAESTHKQELITLLDIDPTQTQWCAAFVNSVLDESGIQSNRDHAYPLTARAFLDWGESVKEPQAGDLVIFPRGNQVWQGHVGFYLSNVSINGVEYYHILGGNQNNKVSIDLYRASAALGIRRYSN